MLNIDFKVVFELVYVEQILVERIEQQTYQNNNDFFYTTKITQQIKQSINFPGVILDNIGQDNVKHSKK